MIYDGHHILIIFNTLDFFIIATMVDIGDFDAPPDFDADEFEEGGFALTPEEEEDQVAFNRVIEACSDTSKNADDVDAIIIRESPDMLPDNTRKYQAQCLVAASKTGNYDVAVNLLIKKYGIDPSANKCKAVYMACGGSNDYEINVYVMKTYHCTRTPDRIKILDEMLSDADVIKTIDMEKLFYMSCMRGSLDMVKYMLDKYALKNYVKNDTLCITPSMSNNMAIILAARGGNYEVVDYLLNLPPPQPGEGNPIDPTANGYEAFVNAAAVIIAIRDPDGTSGIINDIYLLSDEYFRESLADRVTMRRAMIAQLPAVLLSDTTDPYEHPFTNPFNIEKNGQAHHDFNISAILITETIQENKLILRRCVLLLRLLILDERTPKWLTPTMFNAAIVKQLKGGEHGHKNGYESELLQVIRDEVITIGEENDRLAALCDLCDKRILRTGGDDITKNIASFLDGGDFEKQPNIVTEMIKRMEYEKYDKPGARFNKNTDRVVGLPGTSTMRIFLNKKRRAKERKDAREQSDKRHKIPIGQSSSSS